jgi:hypothetical protein
MFMQFFSRRAKSGLFFLILGAAAFIRAWQLGSIPVSLYWDEVAMLADARVVAETGKDIHGLPTTHFIFPSYGDYKLPPQPVSRCSESAKPHCVCPASWLVSGR